MKKFMIVINGEDGTSAVFTDDAQKAEQTRMDAECGLGWRAQVYEWVDREDDKNDPDDCDQYRLWYE